MRVRARILNKRNLQALFDIPAQTCQRTAEQYSGGGTVTQPERAAVLGLGGVLVLCDYQLSPTRQYVSLRSRTDNLTRAAFTTRSKAALALGSNSSASVA